MKSLFIYAVKIQFFGRNNFVLPKNYIIVFSLNSLLCELLYFVSQNPMNLNRNILSPGDMFLVHRCMIFDFPCLVLILKTPVLLSSSHLFHIDMKSILKLFSYQIFGSEIFLIHLLLLDLTLKMYFFCRTLIPFFKVQRF